MKLDGYAVWDFLNRLIDRVAAALSNRSGLPPAPLVGPGRRSETRRQKLRRLFGTRRAR